MLEPLASFFAAFAAIFVVVEPIGVAPIFASLTRGHPIAERRRIALRASIVGAALLLVFAAIGRPLLSALGISLDAFRVAGGGLLLLTALDMLRARQSSCRCSSSELADAETREDVAIIPIAMPLLAGPGALATVTMLVTRAEGAWDLAAIVLAILATFGLSWLVLRSATALERMLGPSTSAVVHRLLGLVLAAMAVQFIADGVRALAA